MSLRIQNTIVATAVIVIAAGIAWGAAGLPTETGYAGVGSNFLPFVVALLLGVCGVLLLVAARRASTYASSLPGESRPPAYTDDGYRNWRGFAWLSAGLLLNAFIIERVGFSLAAALLFVCAARGFGSTRVLRDFVLGLAIAWPLYLLFTKALGVTLPALLGRGGFI